MICGVLISRAGAGFVRTTLILSGTAHALLWALIALSGPEPMARQQTESPIDVEIVSPKDVDQASQARDGDKADASSQENLVAEPVSQADRREQPPQAQQERKAQGSEVKQAPERPAPTADRRSAGVSASATASADQPKSKPDQPRSESQPQPQMQTQPWSTWFDSALSSPLVTASAGLDTAVPAAKLSESEIAEFKRHLQQCWKPPAALARGGQVVVVLRVALRPSGELMAEPDLIAGTASEEGAALMHTAVRALQQCQPYGFLPAAKYKEWKVLDLGFSPTGLSSLPVL